MSEFVSVPVPIDRVHEVYRLLASQPSRKTIGPHVTENGYPEGWSQSMIERMFVESSSPMRRILHSIAERSPNWTTTVEIAEASDLTARQVVASLGPFEKRVRGRYGMSCWPFEAREFVDVGMFKYCMSRGTAEGIIAVMEDVEAREQNPHG